MTETSAEPKRKLPLRSVLAVVLALVAALAPRAALRPTRVWIAMSAMDMDGSMRVIS